MKNSKMDYNKDTVSEVASMLSVRCKKGKFIIVFCATEKIYKQLFSALKLDRKKKLGFLPLKRGLFTYKGIVALVVEKKYSRFNKYFDEVISYGTTRT